MKTIGLLLALLPLATDVHAQYVVRDRQGRVIERVEPLYPGADTWVRRGRAGERLGTVERMPYGEQLIRSRAGDKIGIIDTSPQHRSK
jgi:hypothetical protein